MNNESDMKRGVSSVSRHYNPSILKETLGKQNIMSEVWRIDYDNDTGPSDEGFWETWTATNGEKSFECRSQKDVEWILSEISKLTEMESVLKWASENVGSISKTFGNGWAISWEAVKFTTAPTLYEALWSAWKASQSK